MAFPTLDTFLCLSLSLLFFFFSKPIEKRENLHAQSEVKCFFFYHPGTCTYMSKFNLTRTVSSCTCSQLRNVFLIYNSKLQLVKSIMISKDLQTFYKLTEIRFTKS